jgi:hypothetical protein
MQALQAKQEAFCQYQESKSTTHTLDAADSNGMAHTYFNLCKSFVHQLGLLSWEKRQSFNLLRKTPQLLRELKCLDDQTWLVFKSLKKL